MPGQPEQDVVLRDGRFEAVVVGGSAGGMDALLVVLSRLPADFPLPLLLAFHLHKTDGGRFAEHLALRTGIPVSDAFDKESIRPPHVYVAPADYHLLVERGGGLALSIDPRVNCARPSIDVLFESAARVWADSVIGVILSGANDDGARGMKLIGDLGGFCIVQDPDTAASRVMPQSAIDLAGFEHVLAPAEIGDMLVRLAAGSSASRPENTEEEVTGQ